MMGSEDKIISTIRQRPGMYLGANSITRLNSFLTGYNFALWEHGLLNDKINSLFPLPFRFFFEYVANLYGYGESTSGWCNMILEQTGHDEQKALFTFFELFDKFSHLNARKCEKFSLTDRNIKYHYSSRYAPYHSDESTHHKREPIYTNPQEAYIVELSENAGYIVLVETDTDIKYDLFLVIYKTREKAAGCLRIYFGGLPDSEVVATNHIGKNKEFIF